MNSVVGICKTLYSNLRSTPAHSSECVSQLVLGEPVRILVQHGDWVQIETEHGYQGWCRMAHLWLPNQSQLAAISRKEFAIISKPVEGFLPSGYEVEMDFLPTRLNTGCFNIFPNPVEIRNQYLNSLRPPVPFSGSDLIARAVEFLGTVYLWGGKTPHGFDCSGLVQFLVNLQGFSFPRDAWQQANEGDEIPFSLESLDFQAGTLLFFQFPGKKIHHVAISLGGARFIHAAEWVRIQSFDPGDARFAADRLETLVRAREIKSLPSLNSTFRKLLVPD